MEVDNEVAGHVSGALLRAGTAGVGAALLGPAARRTPASAGTIAGTVAATKAGGPALALDAIQGNSLAGFGKDFQRLLFFELPRADRARHWLGSVVDGLAACDEVLAYNDLYRRSVAHSRTSQSSAAWSNLALTWQGLAALGVPVSQLNSFPEAFREGMARRAALLGDVGRNAPSAWVAPFGSTRLHGVLMLAADREADLDRERDVALARMAASGVRLMLDQAGRGRSDEPGHEHFGFKDGISQPGIRGVTVPANPADPDQGAPGQDLLWPGEFVLGYPTQVPTPKTSTSSVNHDPGRCPWAGRRGRSTAVTWCSAGCDRMSPGSGDSCETRPARPA